MPDFSLPDRFRDTEHLEDVMTTPAPELVSELGKIDGDIIVLGVGGKIGPTWRGLPSAPRRESASSALRASAKRVCARR